MNINEVLRHLGGAYFHQDYMDDGGDPPDIVRAFSVENELSTVMVLHGWLVAKLSVPVTEDEARVIWMKQVHSMYDPARDGISYRAWLQQVADLTGLAIDDRVADAKRRA